MDTHGIPLNTKLAERYTIEREIGRGGMATVYLATDTRHHRSVAIKVLSPQLAAVVGPERFLHEIRIAARLAHPHILPLFDSGAAEVEGRGPSVESSTLDSRPSTLLYYTMPYIAGDSLRDRLRREGALPVGEAVRIAHRMAAALAYAHARDVVHRDIKPENILLGDGEPMLADFGIARATGLSDERLTGAGMVIGTPSYMSPEQVAGEPTDGRSDVYALGCVLYEMLLGQPPFVGGSAEVLLRRQRVEIPAPIAPLRPSVTPRLQDALDRALAKLPGDRFQSAAEFAGELEAIASEPYVSGARHAAPPRRWQRFAWLTVPFAAVLAIVLLAAWPRTALDANRVVVFPLSETGVTVADAPGQSVALLLGHAIQPTEPLRWIDGWTLLDPGQRATTLGVPARTERALARRAGARYFLDGSIVMAADSTTVILRLYDAGADSLVAQAAGSAPSGSVTPTMPSLGVLSQLLPLLLTPSRKFDPQILASLAGHDPIALAWWLQGDRAYRDGRFEPALDFYRRAVERDSSLALAALSGAQAAGWLAMQEDAVALARLALRHSASLPRRFGDLAAAFAAFGAGRADTAAARVTRALAGDSLWADAWAIKGEIYLHLLPAGGNLDSIAEASFARAASLDPAFAPPLNHLAELMLRRGDVADAEPLIARLRRGTADSVLFAPLLLMRDCVRGGPDAPHWQAAVASDPSIVLTAARQLAAGGSHAACAQRGFRAILDHPSADQAYSWGALVGLNAALMGTGQDATARQLLDSAVVDMPGAIALYLFNAVAGKNPGDWDTQDVRELWSEPSATPTSRIWYLGEWAAAHRDTARVAALAEVAAGRRDSTALPSDSLLAGMLEARRVLLRGDSQAAIAEFEALTSVTPLDSLVWDPWDALAAERVRLAELLLTRGAADRALSVLSPMDGSQALAFIAFLPKVLELRAQAEERGGRRRQAVATRARLARLNEMTRPLAGGTGRQ
ncbi:MAG TPA: protein kinase [Gemmatimonadales bacterium]|jgi:serine/threonine-protein kinase|nr:protein kinase [Gemmatimonadales bacterium]